MKAFNLHTVDLVIIGAYLVVIIIAGFMMSRRASQNMDNYFLGGKRIPWWMLGVANASGMFDITGTMWLVTLLFVYGLKSVWIPWLWPVFNQVFLMIYVSAWLRRSNVMTGAEWIKTRFGRGMGSELSHISVVVFALLAVLSMVGYAFQGVGKFADVFLPWDLSITTTVEGEPEEAKAGAETKKEVAAKPDDKPAAEQPREAAAKPEEKAAPVEEKKTETAQETRAGPPTHTHTILSSGEVYGLIILFITTLYVMFGGMFSVVVTDLIQFAIMTVVSVAIAIIAINEVSAGELAKVIPEGWKNVFFGWKLDLNWSNELAAVNQKIADDGWVFFGMFFIMVLFKGILASGAGPAPNYDMQKVLSTRNPKEAALMSFSTCLVLYLPRYLMIAGIAVIALVCFNQQIAEMGAGVDLERILPEVIQGYLPVGLIGLVLAGLLAAFMSTFDCTVNCGASYVVNDIYKRYINPLAPPKRYVYMSYITTGVLVVLGVLVGLMLENIHGATMWVVAGLYAGYVAPNFLKWHWWRFNGHGYFAGMVGGTVSAIVLQAIETFAKGAIATAAKASELAGKTIEPTGWHYEIYSWVQGQTSDFQFMLGMFPVMLIVSGVACVLVSWLTRPVEDEVLMEFYRTVRPWGVWGPIRRKVLMDGRPFTDDASFGRDVTNVTVGVVWQTALTLIPIYLVIREYTAMGVTIAVAVVTSIFLKFNWFNKLKEE